MSAEIIGAVGATLVELLRDRLSASPEQSQQIALVSPAEAAATDVRLGLFLFSVQESAFRRHEPLPVLDAELERPAPLALDLHYLLTAYTEKGHGSDELHERTVAAQKLLSRAMQVFFENPVLTVSQSGEESTPGLQLRLMLQTMTVEDLTRIWSSFPNSPYQLSVAYLVTPARIEPIPEG